MPIATLKFRLPEEEAEFSAACKAADYKIVLWEIVSELRQRAKHGTPLHDGSSELDAIREKIFEICQDRGINPYDD